MIESQLSEFESLLTPDDPHPVEIVPADGTSPILLVCDHAGDAVPQKLQNQMPAPADMARHIAIDVGARALAIEVAQRIGATLVMQRYSRLVIDMNRPPESHELCPRVSDATTIDFNQDLTDCAKKARLQEIFEPYHGKISDTLDDSAAPHVGLVAIHSFSPQLVNQPPRPWHVDLISRTSLDQALRLKQILQSERPELKIGVNEIFAVSDKSDYTLRTHAESRQLLGVSIEVRNDMLSDADKVTEWGKLLAESLPAAFSEYSFRSDPVAS